MKKPRFTESQIVQVLWKRKYAGMGTPELRKLRQQEEEITRLKRLVADLMLDK